MATGTTASTNTRPKSCQVASSDVRSCLKFFSLWKSHPLNWPKPEPQPFRHTEKKDTSPFASLLGDSTTPPPPIYDNQCAIKMSIALQDGGLSLDTYPKARSENREVWAVKKKYRGALAASELANWLVKAIGKPVSMTGKDAFDQVKGKTGIIFFENFWSRPGESSQDGDHIDLWNGATTPGMAASLYTTTPNYFTRSPTVWYWEIK